MIYFLQCHDGGPIKIGTTIRLSQRLKQLASEYGAELRVLAVLDGSYPEEKGLHRRFAHLRVVNELFEPGDDLLGFIVTEGREWDGADEVPGDVSVKMDTEVVDDCRIAAAFCGMSLAEYLSERMRVAAKKDIDDGYARRAGHAEVTKEKPPKKGGKQP